MQTRTLVVGGLVVVVVALLGYVLYTGGYLNTGTTMTGQVTLPDASRLAFLAEENGTTVGYLGTAGGALEKLPAFQAGESLVTIARGGQKTFVLTESAADSENTIYEFVDGTFARRYSGAGLAPFLEVSPDGTQVGFVSEESGSQRALIFTLGSDAPEPLDVGSAGHVRFFTHEQTPGLWLINGNTLSIRFMTDGVWSEPKEVFTGEMPITSFASNGASRFAYADTVKSAIEEMSIDSLEPFAASTRGTYSALPHSVFFWGADFYSLMTELIPDNSPIKTVIVAPLSRPDEQMVYPVGELVSGIQEVFGLNP